MRSTVCATPRHIYLAAAAYAGWVLALITLILTLFSGNSALEEEYTIKAHILDGLRRTDIVGDAKAGLSAAQSGAILAPSQTLAASKLQKQIMDRLNEAGGVLQSLQAEPAPETTADGLQQLVARLTFDSSTAALQRLLFDLETGVPFVFVETLTAQPSTSAASGMRAGDRLRVTLVVSSYWKNSEAGQKLP